MFVLINLPTRMFLSLFFLRSASLQTLMLIMLTRGRLWNSKCSPQKQSSPFCLQDVLAYSVLSKHTSQKYLQILYMLSKIRLINFSLICHIQVIVVRGVHCCYCLYPVATIYLCFYSREPFATFKFVNQLKMLFVNLLYVGPRVEPSFSLFGCLVIHYFKLQHYRHIVVLLHSLFQQIKLQLLSFFIRLTLFEKKNS